MNEWDFWVMDSIMKIYIYIDVTELSKTGSILALKDNKNNS